MVKNSNVRLKNMAHQHLVKMSKKFDKSMIDIASEAIMIFLNDDERANAQRRNIVHLEKKLQKYQSAEYTLSFFTFAIGALFGLCLSCMYFLRPG